MLLDNEPLELNKLFFIEHRGQAYKILIELVEKEILTKVLGFTGGNQLETSRILGINRNTLRTKIRKFGIRK